MQNLISQAEFVKLVNGKQGTISKWIKAGKLPSKKGKLIMPEAEKAYRLLQAGISINIYPTVTQQPNNSTEYVTFDNDQLSVPLDKLYSFKCNGLNLCAHNFTSWKDASIYTDSISVAVNQLDDYTTAEISLPDPATINNEDLDYIYLEIVPDEKMTEHSKLLKAKYSINPIDYKHYLITESELLEFLKTRKPL